MSYYKHYCPNAQQTIDSDHELYLDCTCRIDSSGQPPKFLVGDRVLVGPNGMEATVIFQRLHYDGDETFWGNVLVEYDDGIRGTSNSWQLKKLTMTELPPYVIPLLHQALGLTEEQATTYINYNFHRHELVKFLELLEQHYSTKNTHLKL